MELEHHMLTMVTRKSMESLVHSMAGAHPPSELVVIVSTDRTSLGLL